MFAYTFDSTNADARVRVRELLDEWSRSAALRSLVEAEGGHWPEDGSPLERLEELHNFSERWDFRRGGERLEITDDELGVPVPTIEAAASELGLSHARCPSNDRYDHVLVLGGTVLADYCRTKYVRELLDNGVATDRIGSLERFARFPTPNWKSHEPGRTSSARKSSRLQRSSTRCSLPQSASFPPHRRLHAPIPPRKTFTFGPRSPLTPRKLGKRSRSLPPRRLIRPAARQRSTTTSHTHSACSPAKAFLFARAPSTCRITSSSPFAPSRWRSR